MKPGAVVGGRSPAGVSIGAPEPDAPAAPAIIAEFVFPALAAPEPALLPLVIDGCCDGDRAGAPPETAVGSEPPLPPLPTGNVVAGCVGSVLGGLLEQPHITKSQSPQALSNLECAAQVMDESALSIVRTRGATRSTNWLAAADLGNLSGGQGM